MEGEVRETALGERAACSVTGTELGPQWNPEERSLLEALRAFQGRKVRITLEVVERRPVDTLRELLERFRLESESGEDSPADGLVVGQPLPAVG